MARVQLISTSYILELTLSFLRLTNMIVFSEADYVKSDGSPRELAKTNHSKGDRAPDTEVGVR